MIAQHTVKIHGKWFYAGENIKETEQSVSDFSKHMTPPEEQKTYTKTEINRMSTAELRKMALNTGVENADTMTGTELKKYFFDVFGL